MMLQHFLTATAGTDEREVRRAMAVALSLEIPHNSTGYERFYRRVLNELEAAGASPVSMSPAPLSAVSRRRPEYPQPALTGAGWC